VLSFSIAEFRRILQDATDILRKQPAIVETSLDILAAGDVHGDLLSVNQAFELREELGLEQVAFLGDFTDRGEQQVETLHALSQALVAEPKKIVLLRGNHEDPFVNERYGFLNALKKIGADALLPEINQFYAELPLILHQKNSAIYAHGGVPFYDAPVPLIEIEKNPPRIIKGSFCEGILWNDPVESFPNQTIPVNELFYTNPRGLSAYCYTQTAVEQFLQLFPCPILVRAHTALCQGYSWYNPKVLSIFTAASGAYRDFNPHYAVSYTNEKLTLIPRDR
jgi:hypothetical protein